MSISNTSPDDDHVKHLCLSCHLERAVDLRVRSTVGDRAIQHFRGQRIGFECQSLSMEAIKLERPLTLPADLRHRRRLGSCWYTLDSGIGSCCRF